MFLLLFMIIASGVFGVDGDEVKSVSVMEGDSVILHTDITEIQIDDHIVWLLESQGTLAVMHKYTVNTDDSNEIFRDRLELDNQTGSLTITNITITHIGLYKLQIFKSRSTLEKRFRVTVYAPLPVPVISSNSSQCSSSSERSSSSKCVLLCSVINVTDVRDVSLSWYKGNSLLSSISVSDLNIRLSLPLEVEYQDNNTYRCVLNNTITNQTQHLNINDLCQQCPELQWLILLIVVSAMVAQLVATVVIGVICSRYKKKIKKKKEAQAPLETWCPLIPDVDGNMSQIREDKDGCYTPMKKTC
ncbi:uncharacterized protein [Paramisgurnus dabryanus]|uniref:uncharacterized protein isoform X1 n=1 Tax=Paramisgurnus dabryanus TaxID=90735 RepID=UPI003CCF6821